MILYPNNQIFAKFMIYSHKKCFANTHDTNNQKGNNINQAKHMKEYVLITGASRGIGRAITLRFAKEGYNTIIIAKNSYNELSDIQNICQNYHTNCIPHACDVANYVELATLKDDLDSLGIHVSCVVNNAGISHIGLLQDMDISDWENIMKTNLDSIFYTSKLFTPDMIKNQNGCIINISSIWGNIGASCEVAYSASKGGMNAFTKALAKELAPSHIRVNAIACGAINTSMNNHLSLEEKSSLEEDIPFGRMGTDNEIAEVVYNLYTSPAYLTGQIITVDGGWT